MNFEGVTGADPGFSDRGDGFDKNVRIFTERVNSVVEHDENEININTTTSVESKIEYLAPQHGQKMTLSLLAEIIIYKGGDPL